MLDQRRRLVLLTSVGIVAAWLLAWAGYGYFRHSAMTAEKLQAYMQKADLNGLSGASREKALRELAKRLNALSGEERRRARLGGEWDRWLAAMTEEEKEAFLEATLPGGFKQMIASFEEMSEEKRRRAIADALREMEKTRKALETDGPQFTAAQSQTNRPTELSPELQQRVVEIGLKSFYSESSAETKAELAPVLEEMQRLMERGVFMRRPRRERNK